VVGRDREKIFTEFLKTWKYGSKRFYELILEICLLHEKKNADYASEQDPLLNFKRSLEWNLPPWEGCLVRLSDKYSRLVQLIKKQKIGEERRVKDETITDTLKDLAVYSLILIILLEESHIPRSLPCFGEYGQHNCSKCNFKIKCAKFTSKYRTPSLRYKGKYVERGKRKGKDKY